MRDRDRDNGDPLAVTLHLAGHCIETAARKQMRAWVEHALHSNSASVNEEILEFLDSFITQTDFPKLRGTRPELDGRTLVSVVVTFDPEESFQVSVLDKDF